MPASEGWRAVWDEFRNWGLRSLLVVQQSKASRQSSDHSAQVTLRKCPPGTGLQITFKSCGALLVREFDNNVKNPWTTIHCVRTTAVVVCQEAVGDVGGKTSVVPTRVILAFEDVHESPRRQSRRAAIVGSVSDDPRRVVYHP